MSVHKKERCDFLRLSMQSLVDQTRPPEEVVIVWDGPLTDELIAVIGEFRKHLNIIDIKLEWNQGLGAALHAGLARCKHDLVARMDADDIAMPYRFALQCAVFNDNPSLDVLSGYAIEIDAEGRQGRTRTVPTEHQAIIRTLWATPIIHPAVMFRRDRILSVGSYNAAFRRRQDYDLWFRCATSGLCFANVAEPLIKYRFTSDTHKRQSCRDAWRQGRIGFHGSRRVGLPLWKQIACFVPFFRSLLPRQLQHLSYRLMQSFDPRQVR